MTDEQLPAAMIRSRASGRALRKARGQAGLSQAELAALMSERDFPMQQTTVGKLESGERRLAADEAFALASLLGVDPADLVQVDARSLRALSAEVSHDTSRTVFALRDVIRRVYSLEVTRASLRASLEAAEGAVKGELIQDRVHLRQVDWARAVLKYTETNVLDQWRALNEDPDGRAAVEVLLGNSPAE